MADVVRSEGWPGMRLLVLGNYLIVYRRCEDGGDIVFVLFIAQDNRITFFLRLRPPFIDLLWPCILPK
jgi:hypothetical protein